MGQSGAKEVGVTKTVGGKMKTEKCMLAKAGDETKIDEMIASGNYRFDTESAHSEADKILLEFVPDRLAREYKKIDKWYA